MKHTKINKMLDGTKRLFTDSAWIWNQDKEAWFETQQGIGQRANAMELQHFATHTQRSITDHPNTVKTRDQITIEALQAKLMDSQKLIEKLGGERDSLYQSDPGMGGTYRRQSTLDMNKSELLEKPGSYNFNARDEGMQIVWSRAARIKFRISGQVSNVPGHLWHYAPQTVVADNWHHLCAQVGLTEPIARLFYYHPEQGQESAVAKAKPVQRGMIIACQGDHLDYD